MLGKTKKKCSTFVLSRAQNFSTVLSKQVLKNATELLCSGRTREKLWCSDFWHMSESGRQPLDLGLNRVSQDMTNVSSSGYLSISSIPARSSDPAWQYGIAVEGHRNTIICVLCNKTIRGGGITRLKYHLAGIEGNVEAWKKVSDDVKVIDARWDKQLHSPLHAANCFLNPVIYFCPSFTKQKEVARGLLITITRLIPDDDVQDKISAQLEEYKASISDFGLSIVIRQSKLLQAQKLLHAAKLQATPGSEAPPPVKALKLLHTVKLLEASPSPKAPPHPNAILPPDLKLLHQQNSSTRRCSELPKWKGQEEERDTAKSSFVGGCWVVELHWRRSFTGGGASLPRVAWSFVVWSSFWAWRSFTGGGASLPRVALLVEELYGLGRGGRAS
ncbi:hypothetical protein ZIOFF_059767 [Zingiber officinale]|uniref:BED-type domain-containing protein n=1 Tax=Zingiber officinale TaxID=94328 RepID=A0A8J5F9U8_ZINOF|nr:hypothetical protein ZIOFF_059767 [Zingiber officinale]